MICINTNMTTKSIGVSSIDNRLLFEMTNKSQSKPIELLISHMYFALYYTLRQIGTIPNLLKHVVFFTCDWNFKIIKIMCVKCIVCWWLNRHTGRQQHIMIVIVYLHFKWGQKGYSLPFCMWPNNVKCKIIKARRTLSTNMHLSCVFFLVKKIKTEKLFKNKS